MIVRLEWDNVYPNTMNKNPKRPRSAVAWKGDNGVMKRWLQ